MKTEDQKYCVLHTEPLASDGKCDVCESRGLWEGVGEVPPEDIVGVMNDEPEHHPIGDLEDSNLKASLIKTVVHYHNKERKVTVCDKCLRACCWQGEFPCDEWREAGTVERSVGELTKLALEHPSYWEVEDAFGTADELDKSDMGIIPGNGPVYKCPDVVIIGKHIADDIDKRILESYIKENGNKEVLSLAELATKQMVYTITKERDRKQSSLKKQMARELDEAPDPELTEQELLGRKERDYKEFEKDLRDIINYHSMENYSNKADYMLANILVNALKSLEVG